VPAHELHVSVVVLGEVRRGVELLRRRDPAAAGLFDRWLEQISRLYGDRIVPVTLDDALTWGQLTADHKVPLTDGLLAAQALVRGWTLVTRNVKDFERTGARLVNPFEVAA
jgi:toxin FitB